MSVGGVVVETIELPDRICINTEEVNSTTQCAIYVKKNLKSKCVEPGDSLWWQGSSAFWTPYSYKQGTGKCHQHYDIRLERIGFSGVGRPEGKLNEKGVHGTN